MRIRPISLTSSSGVSEVPGGNPNVMVFTAPMAMLTPKNHFGRRTGNQTSPMMILAIQAATPAVTRAATPSLTLAVTPSLTLKVVTRAATPSLMKKRREEEEEEETTGDTTPGSESEPRFESELLF